jgi:hypothetical protein
LYELKNIMSIANSLAVLAATTPPKRKAIFNVGKANARIKELETQLGLPPGRDFFNVGKANARIRELEAQLSQPAPVAQPAQSVAAVQPAAPPAVMSSDTISASTLTALCRAIYGIDAETNFEAQRKRLTQSGLVVPGLTPAAANPHFTQRFVGIARSVRADRQAKIDAFFTNK